MNYKEFFRGDYLIAEELGQRTPTLTIRDVRKVRLASAGTDDEGGKTEERDRGVVYFAGKERGWVLNRTNAECLAAMWGAETDRWVGRRVTIYAAQVRLGGKTVLGIRVKGSPDLDRPLVVTIQLPRRRPVKMTMDVTGRPRPVRTDQGEVPPEDLPPASEPGEEG